MQDLGEKSSRKYRKGDSAPVKTQAVLEIVEWLASNDCHELDDAGLIAGLGLRLRKIGLPVDRLTLHLRTLHPEIFGRTVAWAPNEPVEVRDREHGILSTGAFAGSPLRQVMDTGEAVRVRPAGDIPPAWTGIDIFQGRHLVEYYIVPLCNTDGPVSAASFCTAACGGFSAFDLATLDRVLPALRNVCELRLLRRTELTLFDTYIGATTAQRILAGHIRRGAVETLEAALLLCDLRGFTELSNRLPGSRVLKLLDIYFDHVVPAIAEAGGEVLKFMGDAVLAFFPKDDPAASCAAALRGALVALARLREVAEPDAALQAGIALHYGTVSYGNIGSGQRLDFTVFGPDVNLVSRIQGACSSTGQPLLMSSRMAGLLPRSVTASIGGHALRGFVEQVELYTVKSASSVRIRQ
ncbi:MAG TPA: adenylate/guanylate cyclase domain-containing protein [Dongiaceae bacterium]|nr:adenylate/guanylate cyclase domain-containing protein [Dongiaceae bacterium]